jgi:molybdopterin converting factor small subunit
MLHATLATFLPPGGDQGVAVLELDEGATVGDLVARLALPSELSRIVLVNGHDAEDDARLRPGDVVDVFPPLAGGARSPVVHSGGSRGSVSDSGSV